MVLSANFILRITSILETKEIIFHKEFCSLGLKKDFYLTITSVNNILSVFSDHLEYEKMDSKATQHCNIAARSHSLQSRAWEPIQFYNSNVTSRGDGRLCTLYGLLCKNIREQDALWTVIR